MTALFGDVIFGPVRSRRLGVSLGVNLLPVTSKLCNFNCIYCECGWGGNVHGEAKSRFNSREDVHRLLEKKLREMAASGCENDASGSCPDVITFAGNGEPTMHPDFEAIIDDTIALRDAICPSSKVSVLSNATMLDRPGVFRALCRVDNNILKLDSAIDSTARLLNDPAGSYSVAKVVEGMRRFDGRLIIQTMFLRGEYAGHLIDNTTPEEVSAWLSAVREIGPERVMIYTIDRDTPAPNLEKIPAPELHSIAARVEALGIPTTVSA